MAWEIGHGDRRDPKAGRKGIRFRDDYIVLWGALHSDWRLYRMGDSFMDGWASLIEHSCRKDGDIYSGHWVKGCEECGACGDDIPREIITLWKIHNADQMWRLEDI
jgi:hypothetical protein